MTNTSACGSANRFVVAAAFLAAVACSLAVRAEVPSCATDFNGDSQITTSD